MKLFIKVALVSAFLLALMLVFNKVVYAVMKVAFAEDLVPVAIDSSDYDDVEAVPEILAIPISNYRVYTMKVTAYTLGEESCGKFADGYTATMHKVKPYDMIVAVDPRIIPYGTEVFVPGYGLAVARDCGSAIKGNCIDVLMTVSKKGQSPLKRARAWGVQYLEVQIFDFVK